MKFRFCVKQLWWTFGLLLPMHGLITVILPEPFRWWKEAFLVLLGVISIWNYMRTKPLTWPKWATPVVLFGGWVLLLVFTNENLFRSVYAARYLLMGPAMYAVLRITPPATAFAFLRGLLWGAVGSTLFGLWAHFGGGYNILQDLYSTTISSWVPGQTLPLYHEVSGTPRLQGASSGPVAYAHIALMGLIAALRSGLSRTKAALISMLLLIGIYASASRGAMGGAAIVVLWEVLQTKKISPLRLTAICGGIVAVCSVLLVYFWPNVLERAGTSDHITKPIEAIQMGFDSPITGHLGELGPAARMWNLHTNNNDYALIAENVFADVFAQTGIIGFILLLWILVSTWRKSDRTWWGAHAAVWATAMLATLWDMTPVALAMWGVLAISTLPAHTTDR